jgi:hypothetical protein
MENLSHATPLPIARVEMKKIREIAQNRKNGQAINRPRVLLAVGDLTDAADFPSTGKFLAKLVESMQPRRREAAKTDAKIKTRMEDRRWRMAQRRFFPFSILHLSSSLFSSFASVFAASRLRGCMDCPGNVAP